MITCNYCGAQFEEPEELEFVPFHLAADRPDGMSDCPWGGMEWHKFILENAGLNSDEYEIRKVVK